MEFEEQPKQFSSEYKAIWIMPQCTNLIYSYLYNSISGVAEIRNGSVKVAHSHMREKSGFESQPSDQKENLLKV